MSALVGDPDLYLQVYKLRKFKLRSAQVIDNGGLGSAGQVPAKKASTCTRSRSYGYLCLQTVRRGDSQPSGHRCQIFGFMYKTTNCVGNNTFTNKCNVTLTV